MRFLITDDSRRTLAAIDVPDAPSEEVSSIAVERADRPDLLYVGADLHADGTISVGYWPQGEEWENLVRTAGVPDPFGHATPALPAEPTYTRSQVTQALAAARTRAAATADTAALDALVEATLAALPPQGA
ncbi:MULTISPECIES: hypothetical protein [unclassified Streptomyces]|uniref:hypothetical protein n=1 Tax=unclassified Streptomyces TaxID=2593676 RepID=UPI0004C71E72|nr:MULTISPECIES: hypothetical protein [unclassified Streptomyces]KOV73381.1 hypothetical protein ADL02_40110 [Streptomyces sp. NRRL WC-3723]